MFYRHLPDDSATEALGAELALLTPPGGTWLLHGSLGSGKTTWTRGFIAGLGGSSDQVTSPTYAVLHRYHSSSGLVWHLDLFRLGASGAWTLGLEDQVRPGDRIIVEWPGDAGPWPTDWVAVLQLDMEGEARLASWILPS